MIFKELFSSSSPNKIYGDALEKCRSHPEVGFWTLVLSFSFSVATVSLQVKTLCKESHKLHEAPRGAWAVLPVLLAGMGWLSSRARPPLGQVSTSIELVWTSLLEAKSVCHSIKTDGNTVCPSEHVLVSPYRKSWGLFWLPAKCSTWILQVRDAIDPTKLCRS